MGKKKHARLLNQLFENPNFQIHEGDNLSYLVRDIINMNWWNTAGYKNNKRKSQKIFSGGSQAGKFVGHAFVAERNGASFSHGPEKTARWVSECMQVKRGNT
jgi:hypothetical protein